MNAAKQKARELKNKERAERRAADGPRDKRAKIASLNVELEECRRARAVLEATVRTQSMQLEYFGREAERSIEQWNRLKFELNALGIVVTPAGRPVVSDFRTFLKTTALVPDATPVNSTRQ